MLLPGDHPPDDAFPLHAVMPGTDDARYAGDGILDSIKVRWFSQLDFLQPGPVLQMPVDRQPEALLRRDPGRPAEQVPGLRDVGPGFLDVSRMKWPIGNLRPDGRSAKR